MFESNTSEQPPKPNPADYNTAEPNIGAMPDKEDIINPQNPGIKIKNTLNENPPKSEYLSPQPDNTLPQPENVNRKPENVFSQPENNQAQPDIKPIQPKEPNKSAMPGLPENYEKIENIEQVPSFLRNIGESIGLLYQKRAELEAAGQDTSKIDEFLDRFEKNGDIQLFLEGVLRYSKDLLSLTESSNTEEPDSKEPAPEEQIAA